MRVGSAVRVEIRYFTELYSFPGLLCGKSLQVKYGKNCCWTEAKTWKMKNSSYELLLERQHAAQGHSSTCLPCVTLEYTVLRIPEREVKSA